MALKTIREPRAHCTLSRQFAYELAWTPTTSYVPGTQVELRAGGLRPFLSWRLIRAEMEHADITFRWKTYPSVSDLFLSQEYMLLRARLPYGAKRGQPLRIWLTVVPPIWAGINQRLALWTTDIPNNFRPDLPPPEAIEEEGSECELVVAAGPVERFSVISRPMPNPQGKVRTCLVPEDRFGNPGRFMNPVTVALEWEGRRWSQAISETAIIELDPPAEVGRLQATIPMTALARDENIANGLRHGETLVVTGNPVWPIPSDGQLAAFGEFHWHTELSGDGQRPIEEALRSARDYLNMDFAAPGDHNPAGAKWRVTVAGLQQFNEPDLFATFFGWENGTDRGHENYYFTDPDHPLACGGSAGITGGYAAALAETLKKYDGFIGIAHHTNAVAETRKPEDDSPYWHPYPWAEPADYLRGVEIMQCRGNQERNVYSDAWRGWHQNNGSSAQDALALGHKLGFVGGTDNHCGWPGRGYAGSEKPLGANNEPKSVILTGLWTKRVERQELFNALQARHSWAVWDSRAIVLFTVNDRLMGEEFDAEKGAELACHIKLSVEDPLQTLEVVSEGEVVWAASPNALDIDISAPLGQARESTHFYLRGLLRNGGILYASPVFITVKG